MSSWLDFVKPMKNNVSYVDYLKNPERKYKQKKERLKKAPVNKATQEIKKKGIVLNINFGNGSLISKMPSIPIHQGANNIDISSITDLQRQLKNQIRTLQTDITANRYADNTNLKTEIDFLKKQGNDVFTVLQKVNQTGDINKTLNELIAIQTRKYDKAGRPSQEVRNEINLATTDTRNNLAMQDPNSLALAGI
jgi:hypothetical protein